MRLACLWIRLCEVSISVRPSYGWAVRIESGTLGRLFGHAQSPLSI